MAIGTPQVPWIETPFMESRTLSEAAGCRIFLKLDNLQPSGSFKARGIGNYILRRVSERLLAGHAKTHFYASSGGNAGMACVHAARMLGYPATVVVPLTAKPAMVAKLFAMGATDVVQHGATVLDADRYLRDVLLKADINGVYVPPFDHPDVWEGNATIMEEIERQMGGEKPDVVICSVGGGGLFNGIMGHLDKKGWTEDVEVIAMETEGADSLSRSLKAGELITMDGITSQATSLGVTRVSARTFELAQRPQVRSAVLSDSMAAMGCCLLAQHERLMVELTVGVNIALCYDGRLQNVLGHRLDKSSKVVIIVCGGNDISIEMLAAWREKLTVLQAVRKPESVVPLPTSMGQVTA